MEISLQYREASQASFSALPRNFDSPACLPISPFRARARSCYAMGMRRKPGLLAEIEAATHGDWIRSLEGKTSKRQLGKAVQRSLHPGKREITRMVDEELAELASRTPRGKLGELAASELRIREAWRGPARWSLIIAAAAFLLSIAAFIRAGYS